MNEKLNQVVPDENLSRDEFVKAYNEPIGIKEFTSYLKSLNEEKLLAFNEFFDTYLGFADRKNKDYTMLALPVYEDLFALEKFLDSKEYANKKNKEFKEIISVYLDFINFQLKSLEHSFGTSRHPTFLSDCYAKLQKLKNILMEDL